MKILVTGGAGFIGSHTVDALVASRQHQVSIVDNLSAGKRHQVNPAASFHEIDLRDGDAVRRVIEAETPEVIVHLAAQMDVRRSVADPAFDAQVNVVGFLNLMESARLHGLRRVIFSSTGGAIYGEQDTFPASEDHPLRPVSPYGVAKMATEADTTEKTDMAAPLTRVFPEPIRSCAIWAPSDIIRAPSAYPVVTAAAEVAKIL